MPTLVLIWITVGIGLVLLSRRSSAGMPLAYFLGLSLIHTPGAILHLDSEESSEIAACTQVGFGLTVIGVVAFLVGVTIARYAAFVRRPGRLSSVVPLQDLTRQQVAALDRLALLYLGIGGVASFVLMPLVAGVATITAIISSFGSLIMVGASLRLLVARENRNWAKFWSTIVLLPVLPLVTLIQGGLISFGSYWALAILSFLFAQSRRRIGYFLLAPVVCFIGLSVFVNYMASRNDIRRLVWYEQASLGDRIQRIEGVFQNFELIDFANVNHRYAIESRLNQNWIVGAAAVRLESGQVEFASGAMLGDIIMGLIPRAIWPDKPAVGGGGTLVQNFTGIKFVEGTSVGAGQVLEFYVNFGTLGVIGGFLLYGWLVGWMDLRIIEYLHLGNQRHFLFWFLICLALLQPGGNLLEIAVSAASSAIAAYGFGRLLNRHPLGGDVPRIPRGTVGGV